MVWTYILIVGLYLMLGYGVASGINSIKTKMGWIEWLFILLFWPAVLIGLVAIKLIK